MLAKSGPHTYKQEGIGGAGFEYCGHSCRDLLLKIVPSEVGSTGLHCQSCSVRSHRGEWGAQNADGVRCGAGRTFSCEIEKNQCRERCKISQSLCAVTITVPYCDHQCLRVVNLASYFPSYTLWPVVSKSKYVSYVDS